MFLAVSVLSAAKASGQQFAEPVPSMRISEIPAADQGLRESSRLNIHGGVPESELSAFTISDKIENDTDDKIILTGNAEVRRNDAVVKGQRIDYQRGTGQVDVWGDGYLMRDGNVVKGPEIHYNLDSETGEITNADFWLGAGGGSGTSALTQVFSRSQMPMTDMYRLPALILTSTRTKASLVTGCCFSKAYRFWRHLICRFLSAKSANLVS